MAWLARNDVDMSEAGILEARNSFSALIERVEKGEEITITRHGKAVARLVPALSHDQRRAKALEAAEWLRKNRQNNRLDGMSLRDLIEEGRRY